MPPFLLMSSSWASYHFCWSAGEAIPKMLFAAGPTMLVSVMATLIWVFETPVTPLADGHPAASPAAAAPPLGPEAPALEVAPVAPAAPVVPPLVPPAPFGPAPVVPPAPFATKPALVSPPLPPPAAATLVDFGPDPGTSSQAKST